MKNILKIIGTMAILFYTLFSWSTESIDYCPKFTPKERIEMPNIKALKFVDESRDIKDLGTEIIVKNFFKDPQTFYNFIKLVYTTVDKTVTTFKANNGLHDESIFLLFKGGNVLRMVANEFLSKLPAAPKESLRQFYEPYFQRSDADFAIFVDEKMLGSLDYEKTMSDLIEVVSKDLDNIRSEFTKNPQKYFYFVQLDSEYQAKELDAYLEKSNKLPMLKDLNNKEWARHRFLQINFGNSSSSANLPCSNTGGYDYKYDVQGKNIVTTIISQEPNWIVKSDNRTIEFPWGTDPSKNSRFNLLRLKIVFDYIIQTPLKEIIHKSIGGELVDISFTTRRDASLENFLAHKKEEVSEYTITSPDGSDQIKLKAYSPYGLANDLREILFINNDRPWHSGHKYFKRINRYFFLINMDIINNLGLESLKSQIYIKFLQKNIKKLNDLLPLNQKSNDIVSSFNYFVNSATEAYPEMIITNQFLVALKSLVEDWIMKKPQSDDIIWFKDFLKIIDDNLSISFKTQRLSKTKIPFENIFNVKTESIF